MKYLSIRIINPQDNGTLNLQNHFEKFFIECEEGSYTNEEMRAENIGVIRVVQGNLKGTIKAIFVDADGQILKKEQSRMFGGTFIHTSDSRFSGLCSDMLNTPFYHPVALHDRFE